MLLATIRGTREQLRSLRGIGRHLHDSARKIGRNLFEVPAALDEAQISRLAAAGVTYVVHGDMRRLLSARVAPRGAPAAVTASEVFNSVQSNAAYMSTGFLTTWISNLAEALPDICTAVQLPYQTWEGRTVSAVRLRAGRAGSRLTVLFTGGMHAAELGSPDICIYFVCRLLSAYLSKSPIVLGQAGFPREHVQDILEQLEIVVLPLVNPDGRFYVETTQEWWRKNRNPNAGADAIGVDINRNFDFLWASGIGASTNPVDDTYRGAAAFSEPETRNVQWLLDATGASVYIDIHGPSQTLVYPWGDAANQSIAPTMNFQNPAWNGKRTNPYEEYIASDDAYVYQEVGLEIVNAANAVRGGSYISGQSFDGLYPTTATSDDYTYSRHMASPNLPKAYAYTFEYGGGEWFPPYPEMQALAAEVNAGMLALCDALASGVSGAPVSRIRPA